MIKLGEMQELEIIRFAPVGAYLNVNKEEEEDSILLPIKQIPEDVKEGDKIDVFVYRDSKDRLIATTREPKITLGKMAVLKVCQITKIGAFLDWGLEKDLLLPFSEQKTKAEEDSEYLVSLYIDKSDRLCATMDVYKMLEENSNYKVDDSVSGTIYDVKKEFGAFVAVDNKFHGLIPKKECYGELKIGDAVNARVTKVREDGKLDLSLRKKAYMQMDEDANIILEKLDENNGELKLNDKSDPEKIKKQLNMSKNAFKRAIGRLLKQDKIEFTDGGIRKKM